MWGQMHEDVAIKQYSFITGNVVEPAGLHLFPCGFLGSSPDGIISEASATVKGCGVLEIKCPWKYKDMTVEQMIASELGDKDERKTFYLTNHMQLNQKHPYWHRLQAEIASVGVTWAHFVVWTKVDMKVITVEKDNAWEETYIPVLTKFYLDELLPSLYLKED